MKQNCKIKDNSLNITVREVEPNRITKVGRTMVSVNKFFKRIANVPDRVRIVKLSNHLGGGKKELNKSILTEIRTFKNKQTIKVKVDIEQRFLKAI